jgi:predicted PurR-regulated permease PerM
MTEEAAVRTEVRLGRGRLPVPRPSFGVAVLGLVVFLYVIREILAPFVIAAAIAYIVFPAVAAIEQRWRAPRLLVVLLFYVVLVGLLVGAAYLLVPIFARQVVELRAAGPQIIDQVLTQTLGTEGRDDGGH